jgi:hypothetical protein
MPIVMKERSIREIFGVDYLLNSNNSTGFVNSCGHCGNWHPNAACPRIRAIEYYPDGTVKKVVYHTDKKKPVKSKTKNPFEF